MSESIEPPEELCLGCGDDAEFGWPPGTSDRHICPQRRATCGAFWAHCNQSCFTPCDHPPCPGPHPNIRSSGISTPPGASSGGAAE